MALLTLIAPRPAARPDLIVVGGVPGAGKSTAIARAGGRPGITTMDPDQVRSWLGRRLPARVPYRAYRPIVHTVQTGRLVLRLLVGPTSGHRLLVHDPATRPGRRRALAWLARVRGWTPALVYVDIDRSSARDGQVARGRVVRASSFDGHWLRWEELRPQLLSDAGPTAGGFNSVEIVTRERADEALLRLLGVREPASA